MQVIEDAGIPEQPNPWNTVVFSEFQALKRDRMYISHGGTVTSDVMRNRVRDRFEWDGNVEDLFDEVGV